MLDNETRDAERLGVHDHAEHGHEMSSGQYEKVKLDKNPKCVSKMSRMLKFPNLTQYMIPKKKPWDNIK